jgi:hypothetical protein
MPVPVAEAASEAPALPNCDNLKQIPTMSANGN